MIHKPIPSSMNKYNCTADGDAQNLFRMARHKISRKPSIAYQHTALFALPNHNMPPMEADAAYQGCLPSCKLHSWSLTVRQIGKVQSL